MFLSISTHWVSKTHFVELEKSKLIFFNTKIMCLTETSNYTANVFKNQTRALLNRLLGKMIFTGAQHTDILVSAKDDFIIFPHWETFGLSVKFFKCPVTKIWKICYLCIQRKKNTMPSFCLEIMIAKMSSVLKPTCWNSKENNLFRTLHYSANSPLFQRFPDFFFHEPFS